MYQASEMNLVGYAENFKQTEVPQPRRIRVYLHRNGMMLLMGCVGDADDVFFLAMTKHADIAQNEILLRAMLRDRFDRMTSFREAVRAVDIDFSEWYVLGDDFRRVEEYEPEEGARQLSDVARMLRFQAETLSAKRSYALSLALYTADCKAAEQLTDEHEILLVLTAMRRIADSAQCLLLLDDADMVQHYRDLLRGIDLLTDRWRSLRFG